MMIFKRREVLVGFLIVLVAIAGVLNWNYEKSQNQDNLAAVVYDETDTIKDATIPERLDTKRMGEAAYVDAPALSSGYFEQAKTTRESARSKAMEILKDIIDNQNSDAEAKSKAQNQLLNIASIIDQETICENIIRAKGFDDTVVFIHDNTANITVKTNSLTPTEMAKIQEIIISQTGVLVKNIKIVEVR